MAFKVDPVNELCSRATSCSRSSTSGRRSTSRRPARSRPWAPERARLPQPLCQAPARVTVACTYVRLGGGNRSRPFPRCGRDRERSLSWGAGASPTVAHWAVAGSPTKVRSSPRPSNSPPFRLILMIRKHLTVARTGYPVCAAPHSRAHWLPIASGASVSTPRPQQQPPPPASCVLLGLVAASSDD